MSEYNLPVIRALLGEAFSSGEITTLAFDLYHDVYQDFTAGMTRSQKIKMIIEEAYRNGRIPELLGYVKRQNPYQYDRFANQLISQSVPQEAKEGPGEPPALSPRRLKREKQHLVSQSDLLAEKVRRLREAVVIETDVTRKFQIEQQLKQAETELAVIDDKLDEIEDALANS